MKTLHWLLSIGCIVLSLSAPTALAQMSDSTSKSQTAERMKLFESLKLTDEQINRVSTLSKTLASPMGPLSEDLEESRKKLGQLLASSSASESDIRSQYRRVELIRQAIYRLDVEYRLRLREIFTPEQRVQYENSFRQQVKERFSQ